MPFSQHITQQHGFIHGGVITSALDSACGYAALTLMPADAGVLTIELKCNMLAPAQGEHFEFIGKVRKAGRTITVVEGDGFAHNQANRKLIATMTATMMVITGSDTVKN